MTLNVQGSVNRSMCKDLFRYISVVETEADTFSRLFGYVFFARKVNCQTSQTFICKNRPVSRLNPLGICVFWHIGFSNSEWVTDHRRIVSPLRQRRHRRTGPCGHALQIFYGPRLCLADRCSHWPTVCLSAPGFIMKYCFVKSQAQVRIRSDSES